MDSLPNTAQTDKIVAGAHALAALASTRMVISRKALVKAGAAGDFLVTFPDIDTTVFVASGTGATRHEIAVALCKAATAIRREVTDAENIED